MASVTAPLRDVLVVGGGLAGLATASALVNIAKIPKVRLLEGGTKHCFFDKSAGAAIQLGPNGLRALKYSFAQDGNKVLQDLIEQGSSTKGNVILGIPGADKMTIPDKAESETGLPQVLIPWGTLRAVLQANLPDSVAVVTGEGLSVSGYKVDDDGGIRPLTPQKSTGLEEAWQTPSLVIGADGKKSTFRQFVRLNSKVLDTSLNSLDIIRGADLNQGSRTNIKAVVKQQIQLASGNPVESHHSYSYFSPGGGVALFAGPAGRGYTYWAISIADEINDGESPKPFAHEGGNTAEVKTRLLDKLGGLQYATDDCDFCRALIESTDASKIFIQRSEEAKGIGPNLHSEDCAIVLVGDAAHAMSGSYGQAANFAFEDAATLSTCLKNENDVRTALQKYSEMRVKRCIEMQERSSERASKSMKGEKTEDVSSWIFGWEPPTHK